MSIASEVVRADANVRVLTEHCSRSPNGFPELRATNHDDGSVVSVRIRDERDAENLGAMISVIEFRLIREARVSRRIWVRVVAVSVSTAVDACAAHAERFWEMMVSWAPR